MRYVLTLVHSKRSIVLAIVLSFLMVAYAPMVSVTNAQAAIDSQKLQQLKTKALEEIERRIANLKETQKNLNVDVQLDKEGLNASTSGTTGSASVTSNANGVNANVEVSDELKTKVKDSIKKIIDKLTAMKEKVLDSTKLTDMQAIGKNIDSQAQLDQLTNVQGTVTKAVESLTGVFDKLKSTANDLQGQVTKLKECAEGVKSGEGSVNVNANGSSSELNASAPGCDDLNVNSDDIANSAQSQLDNIGTIMTTIGSVLASALTLIMGFVSSFSGILGSMGNLGSLGDVSNISSLGNIGGLMSSFTAITSQLDIAGGMSGNAQGLLSSVSSITSAFNF